LRCGIAQRAHGSTARRFVKPSALFCLLAATRVAPRFLSTAPVDSSRDKHVEHALRAASALVFVRCVAKFASARADQQRIVSSTGFARSMKKNRPCSSLRDA
jgi:hypothetical protein